MKKANFDVPGFEPAQNVELIESLKKNPLIQKLLKKNQCGQEMVEQFPQRFSNWLEEANRCEGCTGLRECRQQIQGQYIDLVYDRMWMKEVRLCHYSLEKESQLAHLENYLICDLPESFREITITKESVLQEKDITTGKNLTEILGWLKKPQEQGLYLYGPVGTGKSYLAACVANRFAKDGKSVAFVNVPEWINRMKSYFDHNDEKMKELSKIKRADFVVFDDIGAENGTSWVRDELLFPVLNHRMENKKMTWFTSNEDLVSLENHFLFSNKVNKEEKVKAIRIMERIKTLAKDYQVLGENRRKK